MNMTSTWTPERITHLRTMVAAGQQSASEMAAELGGVSRNAVIGKVHRLGLEWKSVYKRSDHSKRPRRPRGTGNTRFSFARLFPVRAPTMVPVDASEPANENGPPPPSSELNCSIYELTNLTCHFPLGDPRNADFCFCGNQTDDGPYCGKHAKLTHYTPERRDRGRAERERAHG